MLLLIMILSPWQLLIMEIRWLNQKVAIARGKNAMLKIKLDTINQDTLILRRMEL